MASTSSVPEGPQDGPKQDSGKGQGFPFHSWIAVCNDAGVYGPEQPVFDYRERPGITVTLTRAELWLLAQRHLNTLFGWEEFSELNGEPASPLILERTSEHHSRFRELYGHLDPADQKRFDRQIEIRQRYIQAVQTEVARAGEREQEFESRRAAGKVSEAEAAAHVTPPYILGYPVMPAPLDGNREPEEWDIFASEPELSGAAE